ncbi:pilin [Halomonas sp. CUBES01]|uniref:pilin n=1 Tax=Halomonas sp. CUBES01 TaxID=2897340 RepID=UPI001E38BE41|nr:pilin [Halomonas sp. CUBES01]MEC4767264.1 pilin [Halomonas sp. CUBES01]
MSHSAQPAIRNKHQGGFTLIELMIVVAIIGVLASIAVPQYQNYVARAQVSEAISLASSAKTAVSEYYITNGSFPDSNTKAGISANDDGTDIGSYVQSVKVENEGKITVAMSSSGVVSDLQGKSLQFTPDSSTGDDDNSGAIKWSCGASSTDGIPTKYLPASCRDADTTTSSSGE